MLRIGQPASKSAMMPEEDAMPAAPAAPAAPQAPEMPTEAPAEAPEAMHAGGLVDPMVAKYLTADQRCASCIHFMGGGEAGGSCEVVAGPIDADGVCMLHTPDEAEAIDSPAEEEME